MVNDGTRRLLRDLFDADEEADAELGVAPGDAVRERYYDPKVGRFISQDPDPPTAEDAQNVYRYAWDDPVNMNDPTGLGAWERGNDPNWQEAFGTPVQQHSASSISTQDVLNYGNPSGQQPINGSQFSFNQDFSGLGVGYNISQVEPLPFNISGGSNLFASDSNDLGQVISELPGDLYNAAAYVGRGYYNSIPELSLRDTAVEVFNDIPRDIGARVRGESSYHAVNGQKGAIANFVHDSVIHASVEDVGLAVMLAAADIEASGGRMAAGALERFGAADAEVWAGAGSAGRTAGTHGLGGFFSDEVAFIPEAVNSGLTLRTGSYASLGREFAGTGFQAHHLNQNAVYGSIIDHADGISVAMRGNAFRDVGSPHYNAHASMESFWDRYRRNGDLFNLRPTNAEYGSAMERSMIRAGYTTEQATLLGRLAAGQREALGLFPSAPVPRIPRKINQVRN